MLFVLDNSVVYGWLLEDQSTTCTEAVAMRLAEDRPVTPALLRLEYANVLRTACKRGRLAAHQAQAVIEQMGRLPVEIDREVPDAAQLLALALCHGLTSYDAAYLELALRRQLPIATQDAALADAARTAGVGVFTTERGA